MKHYKEFYELSPEELQAIYYHLAALAKLLIMEPYPSDLEATLQEIF